MENISPEERLFNVIKEGIPQTAKKTETEKNPAAQNLGTGAGVLKWQGAARDWFCKVCSDGKNILCEIDIEEANKILTAVLGALVIFLLADFIVSSPNLKKIHRKIFAQAPAESKRKIVTLLEPVSVYVNIAAKRDLFSPATSAKTAEADPQEGAALSETLKELSLVGIYWGEVPEAMIEDIKEKKTYFLKVGQRIRGLKVEAIFEDRIILEYDNQRLEFM